ncbi:MAG TPA: hypothetical protein VKX46_04875, partial [Ktedonobacteraceae bacterium]|nr:hypothetical protein [Ktedonobacteraceae bacterium]
MRDQEQEYPRHQPGRGAHEHHDPFAIQDEGELEDRPRGPMHQREQATTPELPPGHARKALITGVVLGVLVSLQGILLTLKNADTYKEAAKYVQSNNMPLGLASTIFGIFVLGLVISAIIYLIGGMVIGRISVH